MFDLYLLVLKTLKPRGNKRSFLDLFRPKIFLIIYEKIIIKKDYLFKNNNNDNYKNNFKDNYSDNYDIITPE